MGSADLLFPPLFCSGAQEGRGGRKMTEHQELPPATNKNSWLRYLMAKLGARVKDLTPRGNQSLMKHLGAATTSAAYKKKHANELYTVAFTGVSSYYITSEPPFQDSLFSAENDSVPLLACPRHSPATGLRGYIDW